MKHFFISLLFLLIPFFSEARTFYEIKNKGEIRVGINPHLPGFSYYEGDRLVGFDVDFINEIAKRLNLKVVWVIQPLGELLPGLHQGKSDLVGTSLSITFERARKADFLIPLHCTKSVIVAKDGGPLKISQLIGKTVVAMNDTVNADELQKMSGIKKVITVDTEIDSIQSLKESRADAWVTGLIIAQETLKRYSELNLKIGEEVLLQKNAFSIVRGNTMLLNYIDVEIRKMFLDGTYAKISSKHFKEDIRCRQIVL